MGPCGKRDWRSSCTADSAARHPLWLTGELPARLHHIILQQQQKTVILAEPSVYKTDCHTGACVHTQQAGDIAAMHLRDRTMTHIVD